MLFVTEMIYCYIFICCQPHSIFLNDGIKRTRHVVDIGRQRLLVAIVRHRLETANVVRIYENEIRHFFWIQLIIGCQVLRVKLGCPGSRRSIMPATAKICPRRFSCMKHQCFGNPLPNRLDGAVDCCVLTGVFLRCKQA